MATPHTHRPQVQTASGLNLLVAVWLFVSAFVVLGSEAMKTHNMILGIAVGLMAAVRALGAYRQSWISWVNALLGAWVIISPWAVVGTQILAPTAAMMTNNVITGGLIVVLSAWSALATNTEPATVPYSTTARPPYGRH